MRSQAQIGYILLANFDVLNAICLFGVDTSFLVFLQIQIFECGDYSVGYQGLTLHSIVI